MNIETNFELNQSIYTIDENNNIIKGTIISISVNLESYERNDLYIYVLYEDNLSVWYSLSDINKKIFLTKELAYNKLNKLLYNIKGG